MRGKQFESAARNFLEFHPGAHSVPCLEGTDFRSGNDQGAGGARV